LLQPVAVPEKWGRVITLRGCVAFLECVTALLLAAVEIFISATKKFAHICGSSRAMMGGLETLRRSAKLETRRLK
jgi:hypothetical protein